MQFMSHTVSFSHFPHLWDEIPITHNIKEKRFILGSHFRSFSSCMVDNLVEGPGLRKASYLVADRKQRVQGGVGKGEKPFQVMATVTCLF